MPAFPGQVRHTNQNFPVLDLTDGVSQFNETGKSPVKGMGVFSDIPSRTGVSSNYRSKGYLAVVGATPFVYTKDTTSDEDWATEGNWTGFAATNGIPTGGLINNVLAKTSNDDYVSGWTGDPTFSSTTLTATTPSLLFSNSSSSATPDSEELGVIEFKGVGSEDTLATGGKILFTQSGAAGSSHVPTSIQFFTSTDSSQNLALSINNEKVVIFADVGTTPTAVSGGLYYDETEKALFLGIDE